MLSHTNDVKVIAMFKITKSKVTNFFLNTNATKVIAKFKVTKCYAAKMFISQM